MGFIFLKKKTPQIQTEIRKKKKSCCKYTDDIPTVNCKNRLT